MSDVIDLHIDVEATFDPAHAINMAEAAKLIRGRRGHMNAQVVQRFANPKRGYHPAGPDGPVLILPSVKLNGLVMTMPEWVEAFEKARVRCGIRVPQPPLMRPNRTREAAFRRAQRRLEEAGVGVSKANGKTPC